MAPPSSEPAADVFVEDETDESPHHIVHWDGGRNLTRTAKDDRSVEVACWSAGPAAGDEPKGDGEEAAEEPKVLEGTVGGVCGEHL